MKLLILHRIPYHKICYHRGIDHHRYDVTYIGVKAILDTIPEGVRCEKIEISGQKPVVDEVLEAIPRHVKYDKIIALSEYHLLEAAKLREKLGIDGPTVDEVLLVRDKVKMKEAVMKAGIRVPRFMRCSKVLEKVSRLNWFGKTVLKPVDGASSENISIYPTPEKAVEAVKQLHREQQLDLDRHELEEHVEGRIWHIDGLVKDSKLLVMLPSKYVGTCFDYAQGLPLASIQTNPHLFLEQWTQRVVNAVQIKNSSFHLEAIMTTEGTCFLEIGARVGGADVVDTFEMATGIHLPSAELAILTQESRDFESAPIMKKYPHKKFGWFVFPGHHLKSSHCHVVGHEKIVKSKYVVRWSELQESQPVKRNITYHANEVPFSGVVSAPTTNELETFLRLLFRIVHIEEQLDAIQLEAS